MIANNKWNYEGKDAYIPIAEARGITIKEDKYELQTKISVFCQIVTFAFRKL